MKFFLKSTAIAVLLGAPISFCAYAQSAAIQLLPPIQENTGECKQAKGLKIVAWDGVSAMRCLTDLYLDETGNLLLARNIKAAGDFFVGTVKSPKTLTVLGDANFSGVLTIGGAAMNAASVSLINNLAVVLSTCTGVLGVSNGVFTCNGVPVSVPSATPMPTATPTTGACLAGSKVWTVNGKSCVGRYPNLENQGQYTLVPNDSQRNTGKMTISCKNGEIIQKEEGATCFEASCKAQSSFTWGRNRIACVTSVPDMKYNEKIELQSTNGNVGKFTAICGGQRISHDPQNTCSEGPSCPATDLRWGGDINRCYARSPVIRSGVVEKVWTIDGKGTIDVYCRGGHLEIFKEGGQTCKLDSCAETIQTWRDRITGAVCSAKAKASESGDRMVLINTTPGYIGHMSGYCKNGVVEVSVKPDFPNCRAAKSCNNMTAKWKGQTTFCEANTETMAHGETKILKPRDSRMKEKSSVNASCNDGVLSLSSEVCKSDYGTY